MENQNRLITLFWRRAFSALIDVVIIYCIAFLVQQSINQIVFVESFTLFGIIWILYYSGCYFLLRGRTLAKVITGLQIIGKTNKAAGVKNIFLREFASKFFIFVPIPFYLINNVRIYESSRPPTAVQTTLIYFAVIITITLFWLVFFKKSWWESVSSTKTIKNFVVLKTARLIFFIGIITICSLTVYIKIYPFFTGRGLSTEFYPEYPVNAETLKYHDFIKTHSQNPVDYVFSLFDKYDMVVLTERLHPEYSQYELVMNIVGDKRFAAKVGNIYTETGSVSFQDTLNNYLNTVFPDEDSLNKATAFLQRNCNAIWPLWGNTNLFDLLKFVNKINGRSADSLKINWYFTDIPVNWETMTPENYKILPRKEKRDKLMAEHIISVYKNKLEKNDRRKKGLVIMNWWHGYGLIRDLNGKKSNHYFNKTNATAFLMDSLPKKAGNVLINTAILRFGSVSLPIQNGKWDKAFSISGNPNVGFNFENSPFGVDKFDGLTGYSFDNLKYQDVFTGFIFYKPLDQHYKKTGFPYMLYNFNDSLIRRAKCVSESNAESWKGILQYYEKDKIITEGISYALFYNLIVNIGFSVIIIITMIICGIFYKTKYPENEP